MPEVNEKRTIGLAEADQALNISRTMMNPADCDEIFTAPTKSKEITRLMKNHLP